MEVHAHTHTARKKWTHYFWEFLMLFLAVTLGFFVENQREHYIEHKRENQYARQLLSDLRKDTASFSGMKKFMENVLRGHKKFTTIMTSAKPSSNRDIINAFMPLNYSHITPASPATYGQMKSSGSLRYIQNTQLTSEIQNYYERDLEYLKGLVQFINEYYKTYIQTYCINHFLITEVDAMADTLFTQTPVFLNRTHETEIQLINIMGTYEGYIRIAVERFITPVIKQAIAIIELLKKEYHLE